MADETATATAPSAEEIEDQGGFQTPEPPTPTPTPKPTPTPTPTPAPAPTPAPTPTPAPAAQTSKDMIPKYRFDELGNRVRRYESFGTPEQVQTALVRLRQLDEAQKLQAAQAEVQRKTDAGEPLNDEDRQVAAYMKRLYPNMSKLDVVDELQKQVKLLTDQLNGFNQEREQFRQAERNREIDAAENVVMGEVTRRIEDKIGKLPAPYLKGIANEMADIIGKNEEELASFNAKDYSCLDRALDQVLTEHGITKTLSPQKVAQVKADMSKLPTPPQNSVPGAVETETQEQRDNRAFESFKNAPE